VSAGARGVVILSSSHEGMPVVVRRDEVEALREPHEEERALFPAVGTIVVFRGGGSGRWGGNPTIDVELAQIAPRIILTAEKVVDHLDGPVDIIGLPVSAVVEAPKGAWPTSCYPEYPLDGQAVLAYLAACRNGSFADFVQGLQP